MESFGIAQAEILAYSAAPTVRVGGYNSLVPWGRVTASGVSSQNLEIQFEKPTPGLFTSHPRSQGKAHQCDPDAPGLCTQIRKLKQKPTARVGVVKSLQFSIADRAGGARAFPQNSETFFSDRGEGAGLNEEDRSDVHC